MESLRSSLLHNLEGIILKIKKYKNIFNVNKNRILGSGNADFTRIILF